MAADGEHTHNPDGLPAPASTRGPGGRRWTPALWITPEDLDNLAPLLDPVWEFRLSWDAGRSLWRFDRRRHVEGG
jgi:hypothetical protein